MNAKWLSKRRAALQGGGRLLVLAQTPAIWPAVIFGDSRLVVWRSFGSGEVGSTTFFPDRVSEVLMVPGICGLGSILSLERQIQMSTHRPVVYLEEPNEEGFFATMRDILQVEMPEPVGWVALDEAGRRIDRHFKFKSALGLPKSTAEALLADRPDLLRGEEDDYENNDRELETGDAILDGPALEERAAARSKSEADPSLEEVFATDDEAEPTDTDLKE